MAMFKKNQKVAVLFRSDTGPTPKIALAAYFEAQVGKDKARCRDGSGKKFTVPLKNIFPSQEALEASVKNLRVAVDLTTGTITEFPQG